MQFVFEVRKVTVDIDEKIQEFFDNIGFKGQSAKVINLIYGTINHVYIVAISEKCFCLRIRVNEDFQYESNLLKEVIVARALSEECREGWFDLKIRDEVLKFLDRPSGGEVSFSIGASLVYFNIASQHWGGRPVTVSEYIDHRKECLQVNDYLEIGSSVRALHNIRFKKYYKNLSSIGYSGEDFFESIKEEIFQRNQNCMRPITDSRLSAFFQKRAAALNSVTEFCLCHNDLHSGNILKDSTGNIRIIDWDNVAISHPFLDFVKIKYWSKINDSGYYSSDMEIFNGFCVGYNIDTDTILMSPVYQTLSLMWLYRVLQSEIAEQSKGNKNRAPFLSPEKYRSLIEEICDR